MPRQLRFSSKGEYYHVMIRGNNKSTIFFTDDDRIKFLYLLKNAVDEFECRIHSYCLMSNHVHIAMEIGEISISKIMHNINSRYARWVNTTHEKIGHVFQGRFKSVFISSKRQLLEEVRYIHLNPVRAKMVSNPDSYKWSSHGIYLGKIDVPWLSLDFVFNLLDQDVKVALNKYKELMDVETMPKVADLLGYGKEIPMDDYFIYPPINAIQTIECEFEDILRLVCDEFSVLESELTGNSRKYKYVKARGIIVYLALDLKISKITHCAKYFNRDATGLKRVVDRLMLDDGSQILINDLKNKLRNKSIVVPGTKYRLTECQSQ